MASKPLCSISECLNPSFQRGMCQSHYKRWWRYGDPMAGRTFVGEPMKFLKKAASSNTDECIIWPFTTNAQGQGQVCTGNSKMENASRVVLKITAGEPPSDKHCALHQPIACHNPSCINPKHLRWGTAKENMQDAIIDGTTTRGSRNSNAKLNRQQVLRIREDTRRHSVIAEEYGLCTASISSIKCRSTWGWL